MGCLERSGESGPAPARRRPTGDVGALQLDRPRRWEVEPGHDVDEGGLPGSVRSDQTHHLMAVQLQGHIVEGMNSLEVPAYTGGPQ